MGSYTLSPVATIRISENTSDVQRCNYSGVSIQTQYTKDAHACMTVVDFIVKPLHMHLLHQLWSKFYSLCCCMIIAQKVPYYAQ